MRPGPPALPHRSYPALPACWRLKAKFIKSHIHVPPPHRMGWTGRQAVSRKHGPRSSRHDSVSQKSVFGSNNLLHQLLPTGQQFQTRLSHMNESPQGTIRLRAHEHPKSDTAWTPETLLHPTTTSSPANAKCRRRISRPPPFHTTNACANGSSRLTHLLSFYHKPIGLE